MMTNKTDDLLAKAKAEYEKRKLLQAAKAIQWVMEKEGSQIDIGAQSMV
jgi:hypothetical protein